MVRRLGDRQGVPWLSVAAVLIAVGVLCWVVFGTSVLGVREIRVTGSSIASVDKVRTVAGVAEGTPLARVDPETVAARVRTLPSVAEVEVRRSWPHTLVIEVTERRPVAAVADGGGFLLLDSEGVVFHQVAKRPADVVLLRVARPGPDDAATVAAVRVAAALTPKLRSELREVVAESPTRIRLELTRGRVVVWGDAEANDTKARVATTLLAVVDDKKTIDVSAPGVATVR